MIKEYQTVTEISGPLMMVEMVDEAKYGHIVDIELGDEGLRENLRAVVLARRFQVVHVVAFVVGVHFEPVAQIGGDPVHDRLGEFHFALDFAKAFDDGLEFGLARVSPEARLGRGDQKIGDLDVGRMAFPGRRDDDDPAVGIVRHDLADFLDLFGGGKRCPSEFGKFHGSNS